MKQDGIANIAVDVITIDSLELPSLDLLKVDVEGMENEVFNGARQTVDRTLCSIYYEDNTFGTIIPADRVLNTRITRWLIGELGYNCYFDVQPYFNINNYRG